MNRIYQGRVSVVQTLVSGTSGMLPENWEPLDEFPMAAKNFAEDLLLLRYELVQDAAGQAE
jgi:hypothetical protein